MIKVIADLHLAKSIPEKTMEVFGESWAGYMERIKEHWIRSISDDDVVLIPGDISWASTLKDFEIDLFFLAELPGTKVFIRGNHDYWSSASYKKISQILPKKFFFIRNNCFIIPRKSVAITGARLWSSETIKIDPNIFLSAKDFNQKTSEITDKPLADEKIFLRELLRLEAGLKSIPDHIDCRIVITHYPPIGTDGAPSPVSELLEKYGVTACFFGHLHGVKDLKNIFGQIRNIDYRLVSADFLNFCPISYELEL